MATEDFFRNSNTKILEFLIKDGLDIDVKNSGGNTRLHCACVNKEYEVINFLIKNGANLEVLNNNNQTPFIITDDTKVWQILKDAGANIDVQDAFGDTIVMRYADRDISKVKFLISLGCDVDLSNNSNKKLRDLVSDCSVIKTKLETIKILINSLSVVEKEELLNSL